MAGHEPVLAVLAAGEVRITLQRRQKIIANAEDGFLSVQSDTVTIVARQRRARLKYRIRGSSRRTPVR